MMYFCFKGGVQWDLLLWLEILWGLVLRKVEY